MTEYYVQTEKATGKWSITPTPWFKNETIAKLNTVYDQSYGYAIYVESPSIILGLQKGKRLIEADEKYIT